MDSFERPRVIPVRMISGSATAINEALDFYNIHQRTRSSFTSMEAPTHITACKLLRYLEVAEPDDNRRRVALLSEGGTVYGRAFGCGDTTEVTTISFPLHISQLRAASEKARQAQQSSAQAERIYQGLPLTQSLEEVNERRDSIPPLSQLDLPSNEQVVSNLLLSISREGFRYIGIMATDIRDTIFLAKEVHQHCPTTVVFVLNPDLLFLHPEVNPSLRGMLVITSYPLFNSNTLWSPPHPAKGDSHVRLQFPDQASHGVYNATMALLHQQGQTPTEMLEYGVPFENHITPPPLWITVVGRNRVWPLDVYDLNKSRDDNERQEFRAYMYPGIIPRTSSEQRLGTDSQETTHEMAVWFRGFYPDGTIILVLLASVLCVCFCLAILHPSHFREPRQAESKGPVQRVLNFVTGVWLRQALGAPESKKYRFRGELYLLSACWILGVFLTVVLTAFLVPLVIMWKKGVIAWPLDEWRGTVACGIFGCLSLLLLILSSTSLLFKLKRNVQEEMSLRSAAPKALAGVAVLAPLVWLIISWVYPIWNLDEFRSVLFTSMRSLDFFSGVSAIVPMLMISLAGVLWALSSFHRMRLLEAIDTDVQFMGAETPHLRSPDEAKVGNRPVPLPIRETPSSDIESMKESATVGRPPKFFNRLDQGVRERLQRPSIQLPGSLVLSLVALASCVYLFHIRLVASFEHHAFYALLGVSFLMVNLALWHGVLRFCCVWGDVHRLLRYLACAPMRSAYKRFRVNAPGLPKIDLAAPPPDLAFLAYSVDQANALCDRASTLAEVKPAVEGELHLKAAAGAEHLAAEFRWATPEIQSRGGLPPQDNPEPQELALCGNRILSAAGQATQSLTDALSAKSNHNWRTTLQHKCKTEKALASVAAEVSLALSEFCRKGPHNSSITSREPRNAKQQELCQLANDFLVGRAAHFLAYVFPQLQNLIVTSVAGLLLMLFAISSYPFQPHNLLLLFNWVVILSFVGIAMWVFIQINRDLVLSSLNGTKPGQISWDRDFVFRILTYGIVPILALLGAQFPQSVGQIISHIIPGEAMHQ